MKIKKLLVTVLVMTMTLSLFACGKKKEPEEEVVEKKSFINDINENTLMVNANGSLIEISCQDFDGIDISNLEAHINQEIENYNNEMGVVKLSFLEYIADQNRVRTAIQYSDLDTYNDFNNLDVQLTMYSVSMVDDFVKEEIEKQKQNEVVIDTSIDVEEINVEELEEAGYSIEDIEQLQAEQQVPEEEEEVATVTDAVATFTDAVTMATLTSADIEDGQYMMLVVEDPINITFNNGKLLYVNKYAEVVNENTAKVNGKGKAVLLFQFNY